MCSSRVIWTWQRSRNRQYGIKVWVISEICDVNVLSQFEMATLKQAANEDTVFLLGSVQDIICNNTINLGFIPNRWLGAVLGSVCVCLCFLPCIPNHSRMLFSQVHSSIHQTLTPCLSGFSLLMHIRPHHSFPAVFNVLPLSPSVGFRGF